MARCGTRFLVVTPCLILLQKLKGVIARLERLVAPHAALHDALVLVLRIEGGLIRFVSFNLLIALRVPHPFFRLRSASIILLENVVHLNLAFPLHSRDLGVALAENILALNLRHVAGVSGYVEANLSVGDGLELVVAVVGVLWEVAGVAEGGIRGSA